MVEIQWKKIEILLLVSKVIPRPHRQAIFYAVPISTIFREAYFYLFRHTCLPWQRHISRSVFQLYFFLILEKT